MSFVVDAVSDVVEGVVDVVGDVVEGAVDLVGDVIETVAENPLLIVAAVAAPYALSAMAGTAAAGTAGYASAAAFETAMGLTPTITGMGAVGAGTGIGAGIASGAALAGGVDAAGMGLIGPTLMGAPGATASALNAAALSSGAGAGVLGGGATLGGISILPSTTFLGSIGASAGGLMSDAFTFPSVTEATNFNLGTLNASNESLMTFNPTQTVASTAMQNQPALAFNADYTSASFFKEAQQAASLVKSPGMSFSNALSTATNGLITPSPSTSIFSSAWDTAKGIAQTASDLNSQATKFMNQIGQTLAPGADPLVQKYITNTAVGTVANGGDLEQAMKGAAIGTAAGVAGTKVAGAVADTVGKTGANMLGSAAANATGTALSGGDVGASLLNSGVGAATGLAGSQATSLTGSPLLGGAVKTALGTGFNGGNVGDALISYGTNQAIGAGTSFANNALGINNINPNSPLGLIKNAATTSLTNAITGGPTPKPASLLASGLTKIVKPTILGATKASSTAPTLLQSGTNITNAPPQKVDVATLQPVADISALIGKKP
jgi:hypothetical protein